MQSLSKPNGGAMTNGAPRVIATLTSLLAMSSAISAAPAIRTNERNSVPACASPERLTAFLQDRNPALNPRYRDIARWYQHWGDAWHVRWDYAFYQMILETNALKFRRGDGRRGDVNEKQNNFAGIGATGGGVPGDRFPDVKTGVHAQIQHLVAYSGERLADPIAPRTQLRQDDIIDQSRRLRRPVTFGDLARRWAADRRYAQSIDAVADQFRTGYCHGIASAAPVNVPAPQPARRARRDMFPPPSGLGGPKEIVVAAYDGPKPLKLAGPDDLPWSGTGPGAPAAITPQDTSPSAKRRSSDQPATAEAPRKRSPVRTIWSRDGKITPDMDEPRSAARDVNPAVQDHIATPPPAPVAADEPPLLPHFKIGPGTAEPSHLGGPAVVLPEASPTARFKQITVEPDPRAVADEQSRASPCRVLTASYGGKKTLLVRANINGETRYTALSVLDGFEKSMFETYSKASAPGAEVVGEYPSKAAALVDAKANCPDG